jgi:hypothetical protein
MYYRVAIQRDRPPNWQWESTTLGSLNTLINWLLFYYPIPRERLLIFKSPSPEELDEQLQRKNDGLPSSSRPATEYVPEQSHNTLPEVIFTAEELARLSDLRRYFQEHPDHGDSQTQIRRLEFARWLVLHGKLTEA